MALQRTEIRGKVDVSACEKMRRINSGGKRLVAAVEAEAERPGIGTTRRVLLGVTVDSDRLKANE